MGDLVYQGDAVATGADGRVGINFTDGTSFNLSSNARMVLNEFVYDPNSTSNSTLFNLTKGTFTFVAGKVAKTGDMKIDTPVATMGIRGTTPRVEISDDGTVRFSTLIEEGKSKLTRKPGAARGAATRTKARSQVESEHLPGVLGPVVGAAVRARSWSANRVRACRVHITAARSWCDIGKPAMEFGAIGRIIHGLAPVLVLLLLGSLAAAQNPKKGDYLRQHRTVQRLWSHVVRAPDQGLHGADRFRSGHDDGAGHRL